MRRPAEEKGATFAGRSLFAGKVGRRELFVLGGSALLLSACASPAPKPIPTTKASYTIHDLFATSPYYIAHRGSGDNWVEHSLDAYTHSVALGAKAIEISVSATSDGKLVCHHDTSLTRLTGHDVNIADITYATLSHYRNDARDWLGPAAKPQPIPLLTEVLDKFAANHVIFLEDKQGTNTAALLDLMDKYPGSKEHFVWKTWAGAGQYAAAKSRGYKLWGYYTADLESRFGELAPRFDYLGVYTTFTDEQISQVVALGKPVIAWEIHYRSMRDRMVGLGVTGMMCSNMPYVTSRRPIGRHDSFGSGLRAAGDLPWTTDQGATVQPTFDTVASAIAISHADYQSYLMGSLGPVNSNNYTLSAQMRWPDALPQPNQHAGLAFGLADDNAYRVQVASKTSGYHVILRADGSLELYSRQAGVVSGTLRASVQTDPPTAGAWVQLSIEVSSKGIRIRRKDGRGWVATYADTDVPAGYVWLCKNYPTGPAVQFRAVTID
jgi:glycerophosphoryl diester phosphodiesterase